MTRVVLAALLALGALTATAAARAQSSRTENPHGAIGEACATCHRSESWKVVKVGPEFVHAERTFPLEGAHARVACLTCHKSLDFRQTPATCASCHTDVHKGELGTDCARCHTSRSFVDRATMQRAHSLTRFPLRGAHATAQCEACHLTTSSGHAQFVAKSTQCASCHMTDFRKASAPAHTGTAFTTDCASCHTISAWAGAKFDHAKTRFQLTAGHAGRTCAACHSDRVYQGKSMECVSCHRKDYDATATPKHAAAGFTIACADCHTTASFKGATFDHDKTRFPLTGNHRTATCASCHAGDAYRGRPMECVSCHQNNYQATTRPPHGASGFATTCGDCHRSTTTWLGAPFDHGKTRFPLTGGHQAAVCADCHADGVYKGRSMVCASCHQKDFDATTAPKHSTAGFPNTCETCHTTLRWTGASFDHSKTAFALTGGHLAASCTDCHGNGVYKGTPTACASCHTSDFNGTTNPHHAPAGFSTLCLSCHSANPGWKPAVWDHTTNTSWPLTGAHIGQTCSACHADKVYKGTPPMCVSCHLTDYNGTTKPNHVTAGYGTDCTSCHTTIQWQGANFDHSKTAFPLTGGHLSASCTDCHVNGVYKGTPTACAACHTTDFNNSTNPHHAPAGFSTLCASCHTTNPAWKPTSWNHNTQTSFALAGAHVGQTCLACHSDKVYNGKSVLCISCHLADWNATTKPPHASSGFPTTCETCHTTIQWLGASFDHSKTAFPLTGGHLAASCIDCHGNGVYKGTPTACAACHTTEYNSATNPHHVPAGFGTLCTSCHTTNPGWRPTSWTHAKNTNWPLTGAHLAQTCLACHSDKVYKGKSNVCVSCHLGDYNSATNPNHKTAGFPTDCAACHTTTQWQGATFNHDAQYFPIYSGKHQGKWKACADCHVNSSNYAVFECIVCHAHSDKTKVDNDHKGEPGYVYKSTACYACHPDGRSH